jgi:Asp-tRNA(Asn)/Glu-tRNA(Gln) amidotransferase B subunit
MKKILLVVIGLLCSTSIFSQDLIKVGEVTNEIRLGPFVGNANLSMGVTNIVEELLMDKDYDLSPNAETQVNIRLVFFDVINVGKNIGVYHNKVSATQIIAIGELQEGNKIKKKVTKKGVSKEISNSTLVVADDGSFNQQTASNALKKVLDEIIKELL